jgi:putative hydrolase of the HAD superfamily
MSTTNWHIFFDLDRTLWDFGFNSRASLEEVYHAYRLDEAGIASFEDFHSRYEIHNDACWEKYRKHEMNKHFLRHQRFHLTLLDFGITDRNLAKSMGETYVDLSPQKNKLIPGAYDLVAELSEQHKLHIITNGFEEIQRQKLIGSQLAPFFTHIITSEKAGCKKPHAGIFKLGMQLAKAKTHQCIMIGDDLDADIKGAHNMQWKVIWFNERKKDVTLHLPPEGVPVIDELAKVKAILHHWMV